MKRRSGLIGKKGILFLLILGFSSLFFLLENGQIRQWELLLHDFLVCLVGTFIVSGFVYKQCIRGRKHREKKIDLINNKGVIEYVALGNSFSR
ncbi:hypothetical protein MSP8887_01850 [Marinomonas spartinae]|uniref:Uncharacterized protein n=1 Tax=Marinomonas spartinae TaxID=1792290 RepID=A0A1A8TNS2_9GAMM|nr:hypothetical protein [Marinomonas spartinae]SBS33048.1 hypothetical protein MSP8887_01850 [Marinomonas spartinae]SBS35803.1 hypothetical protein MSP8886_03488 [Marinomonas spartinae]